jgi:hypothetical protein
MRLFDWSRKPPPAARLDAVIVPAGAIDGTEPDLPMYVGMFVSNALSWSALYERDELPFEALLVAHLEYYRAEVNNGGHAQFVGNSDWDPDIRADIALGLSTLGLDEAARIFADLEAFDAAEPARFERSHGESDEIDPFFFALDDRFNGPVEAALARANEDWARTRPWLRGMPDAEYFRTRAFVPPPHPARDQRIEALGRRGKNRS